MLDVELLRCKNEKYHKDCDWVHAKMRYPDTLYLPLKGRLISEVSKTGTGYRIKHDRIGILTTIKLGHDGKVFIADRPEALRVFALY